LPGHEELGRAILDVHGQPSGSPANYEATRGSPSVDSGPVVLAPAAAVMSLTGGMNTVITTQTYRGVRWVLTNDVLSGPFCMDCRLPLHRGFGDPKPAPLDTRVGRLGKLVCVNCSRRYDMEGGILGVTIRQAKQELEEIIATRRAAS
jgi:hypothetical protein